MLVKIKGEGKMKLTARIRDILKEREEEAYKFGNVDELDYITSVFNDVIIIEQKLKELNKKIIKMREDVKITPR
jgi:hypothetical protein